MGCVPHILPVIMLSVVFAFGFQGGGNTAGLHSFLKETLLFCCSFLDRMECADCGNRISFTTLTTI